MIKDIRQQPATEPAAHAPDFDSAAPVNGMFANAAFVVLSQPRAGGIATLGLPT